MSTSLLPPNRRKLSMHPLYKMKLFHNCYIIMRVHEYECETTALSNGCMQVFIFQREFLCNGWAFKENDLYETNLPRRFVSKLIHNNELLYHNTTVVMNLFHVSYLIYDYSICEFTATYTRWLGKSWKQTRT